MWTKVLWNYCWWKNHPAITSWYGKTSLRIYRVLYIPGGCLGCLPSTVSQEVLNNMFARPEHIPKQASVSSKCGAGVKKDVVLPDFWFSSCSLVYIDNSCALAQNRTSTTRRKQRGSPSLADINQTSPRYKIGTVHPGRLTWNLQITHLERKMIWTNPPWLWPMLIFQGVGRKCDVKGTYFLTMWTAKGWVHEKHLASHAYIFTQKHSSCSVRFAQNTCH